MSVSPSELRANIYRLLDQVLEAGVPLEVERNGRTLRIVPVEPASKLDRLIPHPGFVTGDPDELVEMDWSASWNPDPL